MNREFLKGLGIEDEEIGKIMAEHGKTVQDVNTRLTAAETEVNGLKEQLTQRDSDIEQLKKDNGSSEELKAQLDDLQKKYDSDKSLLETQLSDTRRDSQVELALANAKARNTKAVKALLDMDKLELTDEGLKGLDEQLEAIRADNDYLFEGTTTAETQPAPQIVFSGNPANNNSNNADAFSAAANKYK